MTSPDTDHAPTPAWSALDQSDALDRSDTPSPLPGDGETSTPGRRVWPWVVSTAAITLVLLSLLTVQWFNRTFPVSEDPATLSNSDDVAIGGLGEPTTADGESMPADPEAARRSIAAAFATALDPTTPEEQWTTAVHGSTSLTTELRSAQQDCPNTAVAVRDITFSTPDFAQVTLDVGTSTAFGWAESVDDAWLMTAPSVGQITDALNAECS